MIDSLNEGIVTLINLLIRGKKYYALFLKSHEIEI